MWKMGTIKDRNGMVLTAEDIKKRCKNALKNYIKKIFITQKIMMVSSLIQSQIFWSMKSSRP